jgi:uncharacterized membrane protein (GlpM family)
MNALPNCSLPTTAKVVRWIARILGALILLFWGFFIVANLFGGSEEAPQPLNTSDYVGIITMGAWLAGLAVAWKWEFIGGMMTLIAFAIAAVNNWRVLSFPILLVPITAVLFLLSWWMHRQR